VRHQSVSTQVANPSQIADLHLFPLFCRPQAQTYAASGGYPIGSSLFRSLDHSRISLPKPAVGCVESMDSGAVQMAVPAQPAQSALANICLQGRDVARAQLGGGMELGAALANTCAGVPVRALRLRPLIN